MDSFNRAIKILERNFPPNHSLTVEFKKNLSKALERYKKHLSWKGSNKTFSNLCFNSGTRRVPHSQNRPTSAATAMQKPIGARFKKISRNRRPITAKTRKCKNEKKLNDSLNNPFGSPTGEECLFSLEEKPNDESGLNSSQNRDHADFDSHMALRAEEVKNREGIISPIFGHSKRFKRPQSAKSAFPTMNTLRTKKNSNKDYATLELKKIFDKTKQISINMNTHSYTKLSKPPTGNRRKLKKEQRRIIDKYDNIESILEMHHSDIDPRATLTSFQSNNRFGATTRFSRQQDKKRKLKFKGAFRPFRGKN